MLYQFQMMQELNIVSPSLSGLSQQEKQSRTNLDGIEKNHEEKSKENERLSCERNKLIKKRPDSILDKLRINYPLSFDHVVNYLNILGINERALLENSKEESFFKSIFYIKTVEKVEVRKNALIIHLNPINNAISERYKIQEFANRLSISGNPQLYRLASQIQASYHKYQDIDFNSKLVQSFDSEPLSRFIERMQDKVYMCKVGSNKLIISRGLLEILGEDLQSYALELIKFKTPRRELISNANYVSVITKSIQNIGHLCDFLRGDIDFDTLRDNSFFQFNDNLLTRKLKKIPCRLKLSMYTPMLTCLEALDIGKEQINLTTQQSSIPQKDLLDCQIRDLRFRETESLRKLIQLQSNMLSENKIRIAGVLDVSKTLF